MTVLFQSFFQVKSPDFGPDVLAFVGEPKNKRSNESTLFYPNIQNETVKNIAVATLSILAFGFSFAYGTYFGIRIDSFVFSIMKNQSFIKRERIVLFLYQIASSASISLFIKTSLAISNQIIDSFSPSRQKATAVKASFHWGWHVFEMGVQQSPIGTQFYKLFFSPDRQALSPIFQTIITALLLRGIKIPILPPSLESFLFIEKVANYFRPVSTKISHRVRSYFYNFTSKDPKNLNDASMILKNLGISICRNKKVPSFSAIFKKVWSLPNIIKYKYDENKDFQLILDLHRSSVLKHAVFAPDALNELDYNWFNGWEPRAVYNFLKTSFFVCKNDAEFYSKSEANHIKELLMKLVSERIGLHFADIDFITNYTETIDSLIDPEIG